MEIRGMSRPESVLQLARKFGEISAAQENDIHKSRLSLKLGGKENLTKPTLILSKSGPPTPIRHGKWDIKSFSHSQTNCSVSVAPTITHTLPNRPNIGGIASLKCELN